MTAPPSTEPVDLTFDLEGLDCADCARAIERSVTQIAGVRSAQVNYMASRLMVAGSASADAVTADVRALGYGIRSRGANQRLQRDSSDRNSRIGLGPVGFMHFLLRRRTTTLALAGLSAIMPAVIAREIWPLFSGREITAPWPEALGLIALALAGWPIALSAWGALTRVREININVLMTVAAIGAVVIGATTEAGLVMTLFAIGEALEGYTGERARAAIGDLIATAPPEAIRVERFGSTLRETRVPIGDLAIGDLIVARPGDRIAMDGRVAAGESAVDQAPITGESLPVSKRIGDEVYAGTLNGEGALEIEVTRLAADSTLARIVHLVEEAETRKAPAQRFVDRFAQVYTPIVVVVAALVAAVPPLFLGQPFWNPDPATQGWLYRALELLVVACPCALVVSTPVTLISAIANGARHGLLIKGGAQLETLARVRAVAFDKTGTLTTGQPRLTRVRALGCARSLDEVASDGAAVCPPCQDLLALASAVERRSEHPLARAVVAGAAAQALDARYPTAGSVTALAGRGVRGEVAGRAVLVGSHAHFDRDIPHHHDHCAEIAAASCTGQTSLLVQVGEAYAGYLCVADGVRDSSRAALAGLRAQGIERLVMLTGDSAGAAGQIAGALGIDDVRAELLPHEKAEAIRAVQISHGPVAMVGDGINDAVALAAADVGIALGIGAAQANEVAGVTLMGGDLRRLPDAVALAKTALRAVRANVAFSIVVKLLVFGLVLVGYGTMWLAVLADVGTTLLVTLNGMRLLSWKAKEARSA